MTSPERPPPPPISTSLRPALGLMAGLGLTVFIVFTGVTISTLAALRGQDAQHYVAPAWTYPTHLIISALGAIDPYLSSNSPDASRLNTSKPINL